VSLPDEEDLRERVGRLSLEQKVRLLTGADFWTLYPEPAVGLRALVVSDGPAGVRGQTWDERDSSANVPSPTALAATWDTGRVEAIGRLLAHEARRKGVDVLLAPTVNLHRTPYGGRHFECYSEDPLLTGRIGAAYVRGLQRSGVGACVKHFIANDCETQRMTVDVRLDDRTLRELYLAPFEAIAREQGAWSVMASYNGVRGHTMTESPLLRDILHAEWGYDGLVMSDWTAARSTEAAAAFVLARNDGLLPLERPRLGQVAVIGPNAEVARTLGGGSATVFPPYTISPLDGLRAAGIHVTYAPGVLGHLATPAARAPWLLRPDGSGTGAQVRLFAPSGELAGTEGRDGGAFRWMRGFGPLGPPESVARIEVSCLIRATGAGTYLLGVSGLGRQRLLVDGAEVFDVTLSMPEVADVGEILSAPPERLAPVELAEGQTVSVLLEHDVQSSPMASFGTMIQLKLVPPHGTDDEEIEAAVALAAASDVAVAVVGTTAQVESEGFDRTTLALPGRQDELVRRVATANPRTVAVVNSGSPVLLPWAGEVAAVLLTWFGGQELGHALADVLLGDAEPGGQLPTTWPATEEGLPSTQPVDGVLTYAEGLFIGYRGFDRDGRQPLFPFGHGTGYTTWQFESMAVPEGVTGAPVVVTVRNTGARRGREVVQLYASRPDSAVRRPVKWLVGFAAVDADPGASVTAEIWVPERALAHWTEGGWVLEPGRVILAAGPSSASLPLIAEAAITA